jgi:hypothetical protein
MVRQFDFLAVFRSKPAPSRRPYRQNRPLSFELLEPRESAIGAGLLTTAFAQVVCFAAPSEARPELPIAAAVTLCPTIVDALIQRASDRSQRHVRAATVRRQLPAATP